MRFRRVVSGALLAAVFAVALSVPAEAADDDWQAWTSYKFQLPVVDGVKGFASAEQRWKDNWDEYFYERYNFGFSYALANHWTVTPFYSTQRAKSGGSWDQSELFTTDVTFSTPVERIGCSFSNRVRFEKNFDNEREAAREKITLSRKVGAFHGSKVYVSDDIIYDLSGGQFKENRLAVGISKGLPCGTSFDVAYQMTSKKSSGDWDDFDVLLVNIGYTPPVKSAE